MSPIDPFGRAKEFRTVKFKAYSAVGWMCVLDIMHVRCGMGGRVKTPILIVKGKGLRAKGLRDGSNETLQSRRVPLRKGGAYCRH